MKTLGVLAVALAVLAFVFGDPLPEATTSHDVWTFVGSERGTDDIGRDVLVLLCERHGRVERVPIKHGQDDTYDDVEEGDACPGTLDPTGPKP